MFLPSLAPVRAISIHASRGGSDAHQAAVRKDVCTISIHASRGGSDFSILAKITAFFISIHASRGGSDALSNASLSDRAISIHASRGGSDLFGGGGGNGNGDISIHASRGGSDLNKVDVYKISLRFQSTLPAGEATCFA